MSDNADAQSDTADSTQSNASDAGDGGQRQEREVARRLFAAEFNDATHEFKESDADRAPNYVLLPTGEKANRVFVCGTVTEVNDVGEEDEYWQARVVDPAGEPFFVYAGQYQPDAAQTLRELTPPEYLAVTGKPRTYEPEEGTVNVSIRPEEVTLVSQATRDLWAVETAEQTHERVQRFNEESSYDYVVKAREQYGDDVSTYERTAIEAVESLVEDTSPSSGTQSEAAGDEDAAPAGADDA